MRRHLLLRITVVTVLLCGASVAIARLNGPPRGAAGTLSLGGKVAEKNCQYCHDPSHPLNDPSGQLEILDLPAVFDIDTDYPVRVRLSHTWDTLPPNLLNWGFQLTAVRSDSGTGYGSFTPGPGTQIATSGQGQVPGYDPSRSYIEHNGSGAHNGDLGPVEWSFTWRSPSYPTAKIYFFATGNAADGASTSSDDYIFSTVDSSIYVNVGVGEPVVTRTELARPFPNPAPGRTELRYTLARSGWVDLAIVDLQGRRVRTLLHAERPAGAASVRWDGRDASGVKVANGLYFARLAAPGERTPRVEKITLSR